MDALTWCVVRLFEAAGSDLVGDAVKVDLVTMAADAPMSGTVRWDQGAGCWRVLAADACKGRRLLFLLFHELAHVVNGDVEKKELSFLAVDRAIMEGTARNTEAAAVRRRALVGAGSEEFAERERQADLWAERQTDQAWPIVERVCSRLVAELVQKGVLTWQRR